MKWRRRRFAAAILVTGLAFTLTLVLGGVLEHMRNESGRVVGMYPSGSWLVAAGATGPFTTSQFVGTEAIAGVRSTPGVQGASPLLIVRSTIDRLDVNVVGYEVGGLTEPGNLVEGSRAVGRGLAIVDEMLDRRVGDTLTLAGRSYAVVGLTKDTSFYFSAPTVFLPIDDVQDQFLGGQELASTIIVTSDGAYDPPDGFDVLTGDQVEDDLDRPLASTTQTLDIINGLLWIMAVGTVASMVYLTALERTRDFAVLKAIGSSGRSLALGLSAEALVLSLLAAVFGLMLALLIAPSVPFPVEITSGSALRLLGVAVVVGIAASVVGVRRVAGTDPALAFGGG